MKQMSCVAMGGPADCTAIISGNTAEEMIKNGMDHITAAHPQMNTDIGKMTREEKDKWFAEFKPKFDALLEM